MSRRRKRKSTNLVWVIVLAIICVVAYFVFKNKYNFFNNNSIITTTTTTVLNLKPISFETKTIKQEDNTYTINVAYPYFNIDFLDQKIIQFINGQIESFINDFGNLEAYNGNQNTLDIVFDTYLIANDWVSLRFVNAVYTGGAHGNQQIITKNFNLQTKQEVQLKHLFKNDTYLTFLSEKAINKFIADDISQESWIKEGVSAKYENFENFTYSPDGKSMIFHFDPYQIAPYSEGILTLEVAKSELVDYFK